MSTASCPRTASHGSPSFSAASESLASRAFLLRRQDLELKITASTILGAFSARLRASMKSQKGRFLKHSPSPSL